MDTVVLKKGTPLYKGFRDTFKGPLRSTKYFYLSNNRSVAQKYASVSLCTYILPRDMKFLRMSPATIKTILGHFTNKNVNVIKVATGVNTTFGQQEKSLTTLISRKQVPAYLKEYSKKFYSFKPCTETECRVSLHEVDKLFSKILCSKYLKTHGYDGYYAGKLKAGKNEDFHPEIMMCEASELVQHCSSSSLKRCPAGSRRDKATGTCKPKAVGAAVVMPLRKRCPTGFRRNKVTGECESKLVPPAQKLLFKRCPNGFRRNKVSGQCEPK
jgi:hypothetical protein